MYLNLKDKASGGFKSSKARFNISNEAIRSIKTAEDTKITTDIQKERGFVLQVHIT